MSNIQENYINPFDDEKIEFFVLKNAEQAYSLWPVFHTIPTGWENVFGPSSRPDCIEYVEKHWHTINPFQKA